MKTIHRFTFPATTRHSLLEMPMEFDLHVNIKNFVEFETLPGLRFVVIEKTFKLLFDNTIEYIDYLVKEA